MPDKPIPISDSGTSTEFKGLPDPKKLMRTKIAGDEVLEAHRAARLVGLMEYTGARYANDGAIADPARMPVRKNLELAATIFPNFALDNPACDILPTLAELRPSSYVYTEMVNYVIERGSLSEPLNLAGFDAFFGPAIMYTNVAAVEDQDGDKRKDNGMIFSETVDLDDWIIDPGARRHSAFGMEGHSFQLPYERCMDEAEKRGLNKKVLKKIYEAQQEGRSDRRVKSIGNRDRYAHDQEMLYDVIELAEITLYGPKLVVTVDGSNSKNPVEEYAGTRKYRGPDGGFYTKLEYLDMPGQIISPSLVAEMEDAAYYINKVVKNIADQAASQKDFFTVLKGFEADLQKVLDVRPGRGFPVQSQDSVQTHSMGGVNPANYQALAVLQDWYNQSAGNPALLAGTGKNSPTMGQDAMKMDKASMRVAYMGGKFYKFASSVMEKIAWFVINDKKMTRQWTGSVMGMDIPMSWPENVAGEFKDYRVRLRAYDAGVDSPAEQYRRCVQFLNEVVLPLSMLGDRVPPGVQEELARIARVPIRFSLYPDYNFTSGQSRMVQNNVTQPQQRVNLSNRTENNLVPSGPGMNQANVPQPVGAL